MPRWMNGIGRGLGWFGKVGVESVDQSGASCVDLRGLGFGAMRCDVCLEFGGGGSERKRVGGEMEDGRRSCGTGWISLGIDPSLRRMTFDDMPLIVLYRCEHRYVFACI